LGECVGVSPETVINHPMMSETKALVDFNLHACNDTNVPITEGATSVLLLMEGQPPIVNSKRQSMEAVIRDVYGLPKKGYEFFTHHASGGEEDSGVSELEDEHTAAIVELLRRYCVTDELQQGALRSLEQSIELRHKHFDAIYDRYYDPAEPVFRYQKAAA
jgi:pyrroloquinoline-quinone synthase